MRFLRSLRMRLIPVATAACLLVAGTASADPIACRKAISRELLRFTKVTQRNTIRCVDAQNRRVPGPCPDPTTQRKTDDLELRVTKKLARACRPADVAALGYSDCHLGAEKSSIESATCGPLPVSDGATLAACLMCWKGAEAAEWLATLYASHALELCGGDVGAGSAVCSPLECTPSLPDQRSLRNTGENACQQGIARAGYEYVVARENTLGRCALAGGTRASCLAEPTVQEKLEQAVRKKDELIARRCAARDPAPDPPFCCAADAGNACSVAADRDECVASLGGTVRENASCNSGSCEPAPGNQKITWWGHCPQDDICPGAALSTLADLRGCVESGADEIADESLCLQFRANGGTDWPCNVLRIAGLTYAPGDLHNVGPDVVVPSDPFKPPSHTMTATLGGKSTRIGVDDMGGGYIMHFVLDGFGVPSVDGRQVAIPAYGRGWQGSSRSRMHCCNYNPTQAGYRDPIGAPVAVVRTAWQLLVPQFQLPLFFNDVPFVDDRIRTEYDFSARTVDATEKYGILAFDHFQYYAYVRDPDTLTYFPISEQRRVQDISPTLPGDQTATDDDVSDNPFTPMGLRLTDQFAWVHYRQDGAWVSKAAALAGFDGIECFVPGTGFPGSTPPGGTQDCGDVDHPLMILGTSQDPAQGVGVGLYFPVHDFLNGSQTHVIDGDSLAEIWREDRNTGSIMTQEYRDGFYSIRARSFLTGSFSPANATALNGRPSFEVVTDHSVILVGTPDQILAAVVAAQQD